MRLHVLSDLHCEFAAFLPDAAATARADVVILAGDIDLGVDGIEWAARAFEGKPVVYVCGNHEFYGHHWDSSLMEMRAAAERCGVHFLEDDAVVVGDVRFLGTALWTDFCLYGRQRQDASMHLFRSGLNDCRKISAATSYSPEAQLTPAMVLKRHERSRAWLSGQVARQFDGKTVVVTHHAPSGRSAAPRYQGDPMSPGFATELPEQMFEGVSLWVHGHMHDSCAYSVAVEGGASNCRVVCNPRGYPMDRRGTRFENPQFDPALLLEL